MKSWFWKSCFGSVWVSSLSSELFFSKFAILSAQFSMKGLHSFWEFEESDLMFFDWNHSFSEQHVLSSELCKNVKNLRGNTLYPQLPLENFLIQSLLIMGKHWRKVAPTVWRVSKVIRVFFILTNFFYFSENVSLFLRKNYFLGLSFVLIWLRFTLPFCYNISFLSTESKLLLVQLGVGFFAVLRNTII